MQHHLPARDGRALSLHQGSTHRSTPHLHRHGLRPLHQARTEGDRIRLRHRTQRPADCRASRGATPAHDLYGTRTRHTTYTALELYPLDAATVSALHYDTVAGQEWAATLEAMHRAEWGSATEITSYLTLKKVRCDFTRHCMWQGERSYDIAYFDAFAPDKQEGVWTPVLVTYCAKGSVRRDLQSAGFDVERLPGPPGGKREMLRATRP